MFTNSLNKLQPYTEKFDFGFDKTDDFWSNKKILNKGYIKEVIEEDDDFVTIKKEFVSKDKTWTRIETITLSAENYKILKNSNLSKSELIDELAKLEKDLSLHAEKQEFEICGQIKQQIETLKKLLN